MIERKGEFIAMKRTAILLIIIAFIAITPSVFAQEWQPAGDTWIEKWWGLDLVRNTGEHADAAARDFLDEGTGGEINNYKVSTRWGAGLTGQLTVNLPDNGGALGWSVITLETGSDRNISRSHGFADESNVAWHGIILVLSPDDRTTTIYPTHDDNAQIWLNGVQVYNNPSWTNGVHNSPSPTEVELIKGENFIHYKVSEGGGGDYVNLRFDEADTDLKIAPTVDERFLDVLTPVEPKGKLTTIWADIKRK